jgi:hypothetical protein
LYVPDGQTEQKEEPAEAEYIPAEHIRHCVEEVWAEAETALSAKKVPTEQLTQSESES